MIRGVAEPIGQPDFGAIDPTIVQKYLQGAIHEAAPYAS
jgi:hypothetical protein